MHDSHFGHATTAVKTLSFLVEVVYEILLRSATLHRRRCLRLLKYGWLVGCLGFNGPLRQYFSLYRAVS